MDVTGNQPVNNRAQLTWSPVPWLIFVALGLVLGSSAVVLRPALVLRDANNERLLVEQEFSGLVRLHAELERTKESASREQLVDLGRRLHELIPSRPLDLELYGQLRAGADLTGVDLATLTFVNDVPLGPGGRGQWVHMALVDLTGTARPDALTRMIEIMRRGGTPVIVTSFSFERSDYGAPDYQFAIQAGFPFYGLAPESVAEDSSTGAQP